MNIAFKSTLITMAVFMTLCTQAQTKREILEEDPMQIPNLRLDFTPMNIYIANNSAAMWGLKASYRHKKLFSVSAEYRKEFYDNEEDWMDGSSYDYGKPFKGTVMEFTGTYYFAKKERESKELLPIKTRAVGYKTYEVTVDPLMVTKMTLFGARAGFSNHKETNGIWNLTMYEKSNPTNILKEQAGFPLQTNNIGFAGLSATRLKNIKVRYPGHGVRRKQNIREFYADFMYSVSTSFSDVMYDGKVFAVDPSSQLPKAGFRAGLLSTPTGKIVNFGYGVEAGLIPGQQLKTDYYFNLRFVFTFGAKVGLAEE